jgi:hypothetical protein
VNISLSCAFLRPHNCRCLWLRYHKVTYLRDSVLLCQYENWLNSPQRLRCLICWGGDSHPINSAEKDTCEEDLPQNGRPWKMLRVPQALEP